LTLWLESFPVLEIVDFPDRGSALQKGENIASDEVCAVYIMLPPVYIMMLLCGTAPKQQMYALTVSEDL
jgi:hypothetical protein